MFDPLPIQRFMARVGRMAALRQGDIRLTLAEATELTASLAGLLVAQASAHGFSTAEHATAEHATAEAARDLPTPTGPVMIDGGGFRR